MRDWGLKVMQRYIRTLINYWRTPKGRHDLIDYAKAIAIILSTTAVIALIAKNLFPTRSPLIP